MAAAPDPLAVYKEEVSKLPADLQEQVEKATRALRESAFPRKLVTVDSSSSGTQAWANMQNGSIQSISINGMGSGYMNSMNSLMGNIGSSSVGMFGGAQMQSPIIYEKPKKSLREFVAEKFKRMLK